MKKKHFMGVFFYVSIKSARAGRQARKKKEGIK